MKKFFLLVFSAVLSFSVLCFTGCNNLEKEAAADTQDAKEKFEKLIQCIENHDDDAIRILFSARKTANTDILDDSMQDLFAYYQGTMVSYYAPNGFGVHMPGTGQKFYELSYDVTTTETIYRMAVLWCAEDPDDPGNVGIWSFYIIRYEDDTPGSKYYRITGRMAIGINIGIKSGTT